MFTLVNYKYKDLYSKTHTEKQMKIIACDFVGQGMPESKYQAKMEYEGKVYLNAETNSYYKCGKTGASYVWKLVEHEYELIVFKNSDIEWENFELSESLCSESELRFGCCEASTLKFRIHNTFVSLKDKWLTVTETLEGHANSPFQFGRYKVFSDVPTADRLYRDVTAYDSMYDIINTSVIEWYNTILPNSQTMVPMRIFRKSFVEYFGLQQVDPVKHVKEDGTLVYGLINDDMYLSRTIQVGEGTEIDNETEKVSILKESALSGKDVITAICEINGCFGHIGRDGKFHYIYLNQDIMGLYPSNTLFPDHAPDYLPQAETGHLYPQSPKSTRIGNGTYISADYEDFICRKINKLQIREKENDIGGQYPKEKVENQNAYIIEDNFLMYGKSADDLDTICKNIFEKIKDIVYRPFNAECVGNPCLEVGDPVRLSTRHELIESYILKRTLKGIQSLRDGISADGLEYRAEKVNSVSQSIIQLKGKTNTLTRNVDETVSELKNLELSTETRFTQTAESITAEAKRASDAEGELSGKIEINAKSITAEVKRASDAEGELSSSIKIEADRITSEVSKREEGQEELSSRIEQTVKSISLQVNNGEKTAGIVISLENEDGTTEQLNGTIEMTGIVTFNNLATGGQTIINGENITTGNILCDLLNGGSINGQIFKGGKIIGSNVEAEKAYYIYDPDFNDRYRIIYLRADNSSDTDLRFGRLTKNDYDSGTNFISFKDISEDKECHVYSGYMGVHCELSAQKIVSNRYFEFSEDTGGVGVRVLSSEGLKHYIIGYSPEERFTYVGIPASENEPTSTRLRGNTVVLSTAGSITTSDERLKNSFKKLDEFDEVYMEIKPCAFKFNNGTSGRYHFGVKAGNVKEAFEKHGYTTKDFGGFVQMEDSAENEDYCGVDDPMGIIYTEFTMWNTHMVQKLYQKIDKQQAEIDSLKESVSFLMERIGDYG